MAFDRFADAFRRVAFCWVLDPRTTLFADFADCLVDVRFLPARFLAGFAVRLRLRISCGEYIVCRQFADPQLQRASSSSPS